MNRQDEVIERFKKIHGDKYDYSKVVYTKQIDKVCIICSIHGEFWQTPHAHLKGNGCPKCACIKRVLKRKDTLESFIEKARKIHGDKYDYSKTEYINSKAKVCIICPEHGEFWQTPNNHLKGQDCPKCANEKVNTFNRLTKEQFIEKAKQNHGNKYDYSKINYINNKIKVCIKCPEHGEFWQLPSSHLKGHGCLKCGNISRYEKHKHSTEEFIDKANNIHNHKYDYSKTEYKGCGEKVTIICPKHGDFEQIAHCHLDGCGCPKCNATESSYEIELYNFIRSLLMNDTEIVRHNRTILSNNKELDIYIPDYKIAFEFDGLYWHRYENTLDKKYHLRKTVECENKGMTLFHIFEDEWIYKKDIWKSIIKNVLGKIDNKINGNDCKIENIDKTIANDFLIKNSIQGKCNYLINYGLFYNNDLVSLMAFRKKRKGDDVYEIVRFCNRLNTNVINSEKILVEYFIEVYKPKKVIYYSDRRYDNNNLFDKIGFTFIKNTLPSFAYVFGDKRKKYNKDTTINRYKIYDCGSKIYQMKLYK